MATEVKIPALGESITSGIVAAWHVKDGDHVKKGQPLFDLETDKITSEGTAEVDGIITLKVEEGTEVEIGTVVAIIEESAAPADQSPATSAPAQKAAEPAKPAAVLPPSVKRIAAETGIDPATVDGSGKGGRVTKGDMLSASSGQSTQKAAAPVEKAKPAPEPAAPKSATPSSTGDRQTRKKMSPLRKRVAERLVQAQRTAAILTTFNEVDMGPVMELRKKHQDAFVARNGIKLGFMSFFAKAVVHGLKAVPQLNAQIEGDEIVENHYYDIGIAVSTPRGLMVPVVKDCDQLDFAGIEKQIVGYAQKAKDGKITVEDLQGGVFTITNGGTFGSMLSTPILNQPQSGILGMHTIKERPMVENGQIVIKPMMYLALSYDHRIVDGREAVTFLVKVKEAIEDPTRLLLNL